MSSFTRPNFCLGFYNQMIGSRTDFVERGGEEGAVEQFEQQM